MKTTTIARSVARLAALAAIGFVLACAESATGPSAPEIAGTYIANANTPGAVLLTTSTGQVIADLPGVGAPRDWLGEGAVIAVSLRSDGSTAGQIFVPAGPAGNENYVVDLAGTWTATDSTVRLMHETDTFLRDMELTYRDGKLRGQMTMLSGSLEVVLVRR